MKITINMLTIYNCKRISTGNFPFLILKITVQKLYHILTHVTIVETIIDICFDRVNYQL